jgi:hypothetical protein
MRSEVVRPQVRLDFDDLADALKSARNMDQVLP